MAQSPLQLKAWSAALRSHPDTEFAGYILEGIQHGFRIGYNHTDHTCLPAVRNLPSATEHPDVISKYLTTEVAKGRMLGPLPTGTIPEIQISRIGVIPKKSTPGKWRLIMDLSFPPTCSVNDGIDPKTSSLTYIRVDDIANKVARSGKGTYLAKMDVSEAYRIVPVHPDDKHLLGINWQGQVYIDATLPFGLRSAPLIFTALADGLQWVLEQRGVSYIAHYLDDFITIGPPNSNQCFRNLHIITETCRELGIPLAPHKLVGPTTCIVFLGIEIDTITMELRLPQDKLDKLKELLSNWIFFTYCKPEDLESLLGHLNHACSVVKPGRSFISRLIQLLTKAKQRHWRTIRINKEAQSDIRWWHTFIESWNGVSILRQHRMANPDHEMWTDASGSWGAGAFWKSEWFQLKWPTVLQEEQIAVKELAPITIACALWGPRWTGSSIRVHSDNEAVVTVVNSGYSRQPVMMHLLRCIFFFKAKFDFTLTAAHIPGQYNTLADALSRDNASFFLSSHSQANPQTTEIPQDMIEMLLIKKPDWTSNDWTLWFHSIFVLH